MGSYAPPSNISSIAIIGAGPTGLAFAKYLSAEKAFAKIKIYEQRSNVGGIWNLSEPTRTRRIPIPQINPRYGQNDSSWQTWRRKQRNGFEEDHEHVSQDESLELESPLYDYLETNIPKPLMSYSDKPFSDDLPLFPHHEDVLKYLEEYAEDVRHLISFNTEVLEVTPASSQGERNGWMITSRDLRTSNNITEDFDGVVVANGHYTVPSIPEIEGLHRWSGAYPGSIIHSKAYRRPENYTDKKVLVIGNSASGVDVAHQIGQKCRQPILLSSRSVSAFGTAPQASWRKDVDEVVEFLDPAEVNRGVKVASGSIETNIDVVVFCTGYFYSYPFLKDLKPPVVSSGARIFGTYQHLFAIEHPGLITPVVNLKVVPFPLAENQAAVAARVWSGRLQLPPDDEMHSWEEEVISRKGNGKYFHLMKFPEDAAQINELHEWAREALPARRLENDGMGKLGMRWNERHVWLRSHFPNIKAAYQKYGPQRTRIKTVDELGFDYDKWREGASHEDLEMFRNARC
jgi:cation diffusion facilitator CzcD-associated flavoprotein CzcO